MANPDPFRVEIGSLRWPVTIAKRNQLAAGTDTIAEQYVAPVNVRADIQPIGAVTFYGASQTDRPVTHRVRVRYLDWLDETYVVLRKSTRPDSTTVTETFRIRRIKELAGRKRFLELEVEQESRA